MTLSDRFSYFVANNLYWSQLACEVYIPILVGFFN
jgi:hypothetical protein